MKKMFKYAGADVSASVVVFLVALPLCLGIALGSNAPLFSGLIAGIVGGIVIGTLSGSQLSVSGPAAGLTAIVAVAIGKLPVFEAFLLAVALSGVFQIILGFLKAGIIGDYVPTAVIKGMLSAIGIILILKQLPHLVGYDANYEGDESFSQPNNENTFSGLFSSFNKITPLAALIGIMAIIVQVIWDKFLVKKAKIFSLLPAPLIVVVLGVLINLLAQSNGFLPALKQQHMVTIPAATSIEGFLTFFTLPDFSYITNINVWTSALTIALVASLETLLNIEAADELDPLQRVTPTNRELKAQGVGNLVSGLIGGLPVTSVVVRTSVNVNSGAKTKMSAILHGVLLLLCVSLIPNVLNLIPLSALAGVLIYTGYKLAKPALFKSFYKKGWVQFIPFVVTIIAIIFTDLLIGILIGIAVGLFFILRSNFKTSVYVVSDNNQFLVRMRKDVSFLNKPIIKHKLESVPENASVIIDATRADFIDQDVIEVINDFIKHAHLKNIKVDIKKSEVKPVHQLFYAPDFQKLN